MRDRLPLSNLVKKAVADAGRGARRRKRSEMMTTKEFCNDDVAFGNDENGADALSVLAKQAWEERGVQSHNTVGLAFVPSYAHTHVYTHIHVCINMYIYTCTYMHIDPPHPHPCTSGW
jgi:hypothetical protein